MDDKLRLTEKLTALADKELKREIETAAQPLSVLLSDGCVWPPIKVVTETEDKKPSETVSVRWMVALAALENLAFEKRKDARRQARIDDFLNKVDEIDDLRREIE